MCFGFDYVLALLGRAEARASQSEGACAHSSCKVKRNNVAFNNSTYREEKGLVDLDKSYCGDTACSRVFDKYENLYAYWFHDDYAVIEIENPSLDENTGSILLISDSFDNNITRLWAERYRNVYEIDPRKLRQITIQDFIDTHGITDALFVMSQDRITDESIDKPFMAASV